MKHPITAVLLAAVASAAMIFAACGDDSTDDAPTATATVTADATQPPAPTTPASTPTAGSGGTGVPIADDVAAAVAADDAAALSALIETQTLPCSNAAGLGGPPPCSGAPGSPPEGTEVGAFAYGTCEREWQFDLVQFARRFLDQAGELYAVVRFESLSPDAGLPASTQYAIIYASADPAFETAHALVLSEDAVVAADSLCGGAPSAFLADGPPFFGPEVVSEGPAFDQ